MEVVIAQIKNMWGTDCGLWHQTYIYSQHVETSKSYKLGILQSNTGAIKFFCKISLWNFCKLGPTREAFQELRDWAGQVAHAGPELELARLYCPTDN